MQNLGGTIRKLRSDKRLPLRLVADKTDTDQAVLSKIERGKRIATRDQVIKLSEYFKVSTNDLLVNWLSDKLVSEVINEDIALDALKVAGRKIKHYNNNPNK